VLAAAPAAYPCALIFLDPPYGQGLVQAAMRRLGAAGWVAPGALMVAEIGRGEALAVSPGLGGNAAAGPLGELLAERVHGAARITVWRSC
jgi:16S rRNA (guanine966-N2)-methyltransferase